MSKSKVTRLFLGSLIAAAAGGVLLLSAGAFALANDVLVMNGSEIVRVEWSSLAYVLLALAVVGGLVLFGAMIGGLIAWIGALLNTAQLASKKWFVVLLLTGLFDLGIIAMIVYIIAGPDGTRQAPPRMVAAPA